MFGAALLLCASKASANNDQYFVAIYISYPSGCNYDQNGNQVYAETIGYGGVISNCNVVTGIDNASTYCGYGTQPTTVCANTVYFNSSSGYFTTDTSNCSSTWGTPAISTMQAYNASRQKCSGSIEAYALGYTITL